MQLFQISILIYDYLYMFRSRGFIFRETTFYLLDCLTWRMLDTLHHSCIYNRLPEDKPSGSKHVEDTKKLKIKI
jgi:hypothetical protein